MAGMMSMPWTLGVIDDGIDIEPRVWSQSIFVARPLENNLAFLVFSLTAHNPVLSTCNVQRCAPAE